MCYSISFKTHVKNALYTVNHHVGHTFHVCCMYVFAFCFQLSAALMPIVAFLLYMYAFGLNGRYLMWLHLGPGDLDYYVNESMY